MAKPRVVLLQTAIGDYRQEVLEIMCDSEHIDFRALAGAVHFDGGTYTRVDVGDRLKLITNHYLIGRKLLWQTGQWRDVISADAAILDLNPRILSTWPILVARRLLRKPTSLWGHAWPRIGRQSRNTWIRKVLARLVQTTVVYTETQAQELRQYLPWANVIAAPNALYRRSEMYPAPEAQRTSDFIYVGRLVAAKKPDLLVRAFIQALSYLPPDTQLHMVGEGAMRPELEVLASAAPGRIHFHGHVADIASLRELYSSAVASVSPGYVGLSVTQSFSFGVPMIIARNEAHAPEIEAATPDNSVFFTENDATDLQRSLLAMASEREAWFERRHAIVDYCRSMYSAEVMANRLLSSVGVGLPEESADAAASSLPVTKAA